MPIRGDRILVKIPEITVKRTNAEGQETEVPIVAKMKRGVAEFLGLEELDPLDPEMFGEFGGAGSNAGARFYKNVGGFRDESYTFVAHGKFTITEYFFNEQDEWTNEESEFKSCSVGFPRGHTVNEFIDFVRGREQDVQDKIRRLRFPSGRSISYNSGSGEEEEPATP